MPSSKTDEKNGPHQEPAATATPGIIKPVLVEKISRYLIKALGEESPSGVKEASSSYSTKTAADPKGNSTNSFPLCEMASQAVSNFLTEHESHHIQDQLITLLKPQMSSYMTRDRYTGRRSTAHDHLVIFSFWFLPSETVFSALKGIVIPQLSPPYGETLQNITVNAICNSLPLAQPLLDDVFKNSVIHILSEPWYRNWVKGSILNNTSYYYRKEKDDISKRSVSTPADSKKSDLSSIAIDEADSLEDCPNYE
jgi:hypothetical protein